MGPKQAIKTNCRICMEGAGISPKDCPSQTCPLQPVITGQSSGALAAIKKFCLHCSGMDAAIYKSCEGKLLNGVNGGVCPLHRFKSGHNPARKGVGNLDGTPENFDLTAQKVN